MSVITRVPEPNIWDVICKDFSSRRPPFREDDTASVHTNYSDYDAARHNPVFFQNGKMHCQVNADVLELDDFDSSKIHPSIVGHAFLDKPAASPPPTPTPPPHKSTCSPREYLEHYVFPVLLPALDETLRQAKENKCFERKRTKFNALDFLTEYLYGQNKDHPQREGMVLADIPFVQEHWKDHPRPPLPKSLLWSEEEATVKIQAFWRGFKVRREPDVAELRTWQKEWREENENIHNKVDNFWAGKMPDGDARAASRKASLDRQASNTESKEQL